MIISKTTNTQQAIWLAISSFSSLALGFVSAAILSRYLDKTEYGTYKQILYVYGTLQALFTIGLPSVFSYMIPRLNEGQQKTLIKSLNRLFLILGLVFSLALFLLSDVIADLLKNPELALGLKIFSPFPLFTLPALGVEGIYTALKKTKTIAIYSTVSKVLMLLCIVLPVVLFKASYNVAIIGWGVASFITFLFSIYLKNKPYFEIKSELVPNMRKTVLDYSLPLMGAFIAGFFISTADQFFISRYYGTDTFAEYANGSFNIPIVAMIASSVKSVLLPVFSKADATGTVNSALLSYNNAVLKSATLVFPVLLFSVFFAKEIMIFIYGEQYAASGIYMRFHIIRNFLEVFPYLAVILALGLSRIYLYMHIVGAVFVWVIDYFVVSMGFEAYSIVIVRSSFYVLSSVFAFIYIYRKTKINLLSPKLLKSVFYITIHTFLCGLIVFYISKTYFASLNVISILMLSGLIFYAILFATGRLFHFNYFDSIKLLLKKKLR